MFKSSARLHVTSILKECALFVERVCELHAYFDSITRCWLKFFEVIYHWRVNQSLTFWPSKGHSMSLDGVIKSYWSQVGLAKLTSVGLSIFPAYSLHDRFSPFIWQVKMQTFISKNDKYVENWFVLVGCDWLTRWRYWLTLQLIVCKDSPN